MILHQPVNNWETQTGAFAGRFRSGEWLVNVLPDRLFHSDPRIGDFDF